ncbi:MAG: GAF domain-containing protein [Polyangiaceae bacterium]|nr:GAF domain-containing protein [Polyangiaceae bacterium]
MTPSSEHRYALEALLRERSEQALQDLRFHCGKDQEQFAALLEYAADRTTDLPRASDWLTEAAMVYRNLPSQEDHSFLLLRTAISRDPMNGTAAGLLSSGLRESGKRRELGRMYLSRATSLRALAERDDSLKAHAADAYVVAADHHRYALDDTDRALDCYRAALKLREHAEAARGARELSELADNFADAIVFLQLEREYNRVPGRQEELAREDNRLRTLRAKPRLSLVPDQAPLDELLPLSAPRHHDDTIPDATDSANTLRSPLPRFSEDAGGDVIRLYPLDDTGASSPLPSSDLPENWETQFPNGPADSDRQAPSDTTEVSSTRGWSSAPRDIQSAISEVLDSGFFSEGLSSEADASQPIVRESSPKSHLLPPPPSDQYGGHGVPLPPPPRSPSPSPGLGGIPKLQPRTSASVRPTRRNGRVPSQRPSHPSDKPLTLSPFTDTRRLRGTELLERVADAATGLGMLGSADDGVLFTLHSLVAMFGAKRGLGHMFDAEQCRLVVRAAHGPGAAHLIGWKTDRQDPLLADAIAVQDAIIVADVTLDARVQQDRWSSFPVNRSLLCAPVLSNNQLLGALELADPGCGTEFNEEDRRAVAHMAEQLGRFLTTALV